jgi:hypothetical protein
MCRSSILNATENGQELREEVGEVYVYSAVKKVPYFVSFHKNNTSEKICTLRHSRYL